MALLNQPWLRFIFLGLVFLQLQAVLLPEPGTVIGPLSEARIGALEERWITNTGRRPTAEQRAELIALELDRDMLLQRAVELGLHRTDGLVYQRLIRDMKFLKIGEGKSDKALFESALQMKLHLDDEVVRRRLIQVMEQQLLADNPPPRPTDAQVRAEFDNRTNGLREPPRYSFEHVYFRAEQEPEARAAIARITNENLNLGGARSLGSPFIEGHKLSDQRPEQLARTFGQEFVRNLADAAEQRAPQAGHWFGPIRSAFGLHYLWMNAFEPARDLQQVEVEERLRNDLEYMAKAQALKDAVSALRAQYEVRGHDGWETGSDTASKGKQG